jgi:hypothetical protein
MPDFCNFGGDEMLKGAVTWVVTYQRDVIIGVICAIVFGIVVELLKKGSVIGVRQIRNKVSNVSVSRLRKRIAQLETYRNQVASFGSSDKFLYVAILQHVVAILTMICLAFIVLIFEYAARVGRFAGNILIAGPTGAFAILSASILGIAAFFGLNAIHLANLNTPDAVSKKVNELDSEIAVVRSKLDARLRKGEK